MGRVDGRSPRISTSVIIAFVFGLGLFEAIRSVMETRQLSLLMQERETFDEPTTRSTSKSHDETKTTVAYAITMTHFKLAEVEGSDFKHIDRAAVLHQSIKLAMQESTKYDYHIYAFVHQEASDAKPLLERLGYRVQIKDTPFNITENENAEFVDSQRIGCCGEKEYLKLYSYLLVDYPVVVHLDLDTIVLRSMDQVFDFMTLPRTTTSGLSQDRVESFASTSTMWMNKHLNISETHAPRSILEHPERIDFMYTRDYNMVDPPMLKPYQMGVQGGFMVIRPNQTDFDRMIEIIRRGGGFKDSMWGGEELGHAGYGGYYGAGTVQGFTSYYYDHVEKGMRSLELNRCNYNSMVDDPHFFNKNTNQTICRTTEDKCEDCRATNLEDIYTSHFTVCGKPEWCDPPANRLCGELMHQWYKTRLSLETEWMHRFSSSDFQYVPHLKPNQDKNKNLGHCDGHSYIPLTYPELTNAADLTSALI